MLQKDIMNGAGGIPGIFVQYEFSPLMVQYEERQRFFLIIFLIKIFPLGLSAFFSYLYVQLLGVFTPLLV